MKKTIFEGAATALVTPLTEQGIDYEALNAFTTQFSPESCDAGNTENPLYKKFFALMEKEKENA